MLKSKWGVALMLSLIFMYSCDKSEENGTTFKDQTLQGQVDGADWMFTHGYAAADQDNNELGINLYDALGDAVDSPCDLAFEGYTELFFYVPLEVGVYDLKLDFSDIEGSQTATFYVTDGNMNYVATEGSIEIMSIGETSVTGRMAIKSADNTFANGNFEIEFCI